MRIVYRFYIIIFPNVVVHCIDKHAEVRILAEMDEKALSTNPRTNVRTKVDLNVTELSMVSVNNSIIRTCLKPVYKISILSH